MRTEPGLHGSPPNLTSREQGESLRLLEESQAMLRAILLGLGLQYHSLDLERCRLLDPEAPQAGPEPQSYQMAASLITLGALIGFYRQAQAIAQQTAQAGQCADWTDVKLDGLSIGISLLRLFRLMGAGQDFGPLAQQELLDEPTI
ncbi:MAG: hypothetical protein HFE95_03760 [Acutalibacter sp.]|jgi:hypothetical protein|nr:hypothetical protein [Acutalibacter sp.]